LEAHHPDFFQRLRQLIEAGQVEMVGGGRLSARANACWWIVPLQTVSQSESGFERVYQGSAILAVWRIEPGVGQELTCMLRLEISGL